LQQSANVFLFQHLFYSIRNFSEKVIGISKISTPCLSGKACDGAEIPKPRRFHFLCGFPKRNNYILSVFGKDIFAERKVLSSESAYAFQESKAWKMLGKGEKKDEEQQPDQHSSGS